MKEIVQELKKWREARNMQDNGFVTDKEVASMIDECKEVLLTKTDTHKAEEICDIAVFAFNGLGLLNAEYKAKSTKWSGLPSILRSFANILESNEDRMTVTELNYIIKFCENTVADLGFDFKKTMLEKIKVISSREQCPNQAKEWAESGASGKWEKNKLQDKNSIYKPDFESCRL